MFGHLGRKWPLRVSLHVVLFAMVMYPQRKNAWSSNVYKRQLDLEDTTNWMH